EQRIALVALQDQARMAALDIPMPPHLKVMQLLLPTPDGRVFAGADAVPELLRLAAHGGKSKCITAARAGKGMPNAATRAWSWNGTNAIRCSRSQRRTRSAACRQKPHSPS